MPLRKGRNPFIIKLVRRSVRNQVFNSKSLLKATNESDPKLAITESLTRRRSKLVEQSKNVFGFQNCYRLSTDTPDPIKTARQHVHAANLFL